MKRRQFNKILTSTSSGIILSSAYSCVNIETKKLKGLDSLLSIACMPKGCPVATMAINGSFNAGLLAASIIGTFDEKVKTNLDKWKRLQTKLVKKKPK